MFAYYSNTLVNIAKQFGYLQLKTEMTKFAIMFLVCSIQAARYGETDLFWVNRFRALTEDSHLSTKKWVACAVIMRDESKYPEAWAFTHH